MDGLISLLYKKFGIGLALYFIEKNRVFTALILIGFSILSYFFIGLYGALAMIINGGFFLYSVISLRKLAFSNIPLFFPPYIGRVEDPTSYLAKKYHVLNFLFASSWYLFCLFLFIR